jgi:hypothetical protein
MKRPKHEVADVIRHFSADLVKQHRPTAYQLKVLNALQTCRTLALGGHRQKCDSCGKTRIGYNSCRNRHCPKCLASKQAFWVEDTMERIIDTTYYHIVFTVPQVLNPICLLDGRKFYNALFAAAWDTIRTFGYTHYGVESGALAILHSWGQNLSLHPHIHMLVPAAGMDFSGKFKRIGRKGKFLYPVYQLSSTFRGKLMQLIKKQLEKSACLEANRPALEQAWQKEWVVFCEPSFSSSEHVIGYLGQYTHRVAISNRRIQKIDENNVSFRYKDYRDGKTKMISLTGVEFLRRFCMHILPKGFVKVRYYGILSHRYSKKTILLRSIRTRKPDESKQQRLKRLSGFDMFKCPFCKNGQMHVIETLPRIRSPGIWPVLPTGKINQVPLN